MIGNTHYIAIAYNAGHPAAAVVTANYIAGLESQFFFRIGQLSNIVPFDPEKLPPEYQERLAAAQEDMGPYSVSVEMRAERTLPELQSLWLTSIEEAWQEKVQRQ
jgi:putative thiamine transport system substrate-binding protein